VNRTSRPARCRYGEPGSTTTAAVLPGYAALARVRREHGPAVAAREDWDVLHRVQAEVIEALAAMRDADAELERVAAESNRVGRLVQHRPPSRTSPPSSAALTRPLLDAIHHAPKIRQTRVSVGLK
jgi:hypothetical protein